MRHISLTITAVFLLLFTVKQVFSSEMPTGFVDIKQVIPSIVLDIRYLSANNFVGKPITGYQSAKCILSVKAANALKQVQDELQNFNLGVKVYDCYRPQQAVDHFVRWAKDLNDTKMKSIYYPNVNKADLFTEGYIAAKSGHSRGSTVDLTLVSLASTPAKELDMGTGWDLFGPQSWPSSQAVNGQQRANRMLLQSLMLKHGFVFLPQEWWHFTIADEPFAQQYFDFPVQ